MPAARAAAPSRGGTAARWVSARSPGCWGAGHGLHVLRDSESRVSRRRCARCVCAQPCTGIVYRCSWGPRTPNALHPLGNTGPSFWVAPSWSMGNQHEKPPSAHRVVNPVYSNEKINAMVQHGQGHQAGVQRGGGRKCNACRYGELSYQESQMCGQGRLGLEML